MRAMDGERGFAATERPAPWRRLWSRVQRLRKPLLVLAGVGTVLGGLAGYWNAWRAARDAGSAATAPAVVAPAEAKTLAVLPFANLDEDMADAAFADGLGEELVHLLSRVKGLRVVARRSAQQFKGQALPMAEMAGRLQVSYLVDGSVRRTGDTVRIGAQLVEGRTGAVLWAGQFERELKDTLAVQTELALEIGRSLKLPLDASTLAGSGTQNLKAWQLFVQAEKLPEGEGQREPLYRQALALDPAFARAHVELAEEEPKAHLRSGSDRQAAAGKMAAHLETALRLDPRLAMAHGRMATAAAMRDDLDAVARHARKALELDPAEPAGLHWTAELALRDLRLDEALAQHRRLMELEPLSALARVNHAFMLRLMQRPGEALPVIDQALVLEPDWRNALFEKAHILLALGRRDEALAIARRFNWIDLFLATGSAQDLAAARKTSGLSEHRRAALAFFDGDYDTFFDHFERDHSDFMSRNRAMFDPMLDRAREHPRFKALLARHGLTQTHERAQAWRAANPPQR
jgi:TolB-like protein